MMMMFRNFLGLSTAVHCLRFRDEVREIERAEPARSQLVDSFQFINGSPSRSPKIGQWCNMLTNCRNDAVVEPLLVTLRNKLLWSGLAVMSFMDNRFRLSWLDLLESIHVIFSLQTNHRGAGDSSQYQNDHHCQRFW